MTACLDDVDLPPVLQNDAEEDLVAKGWELVAAAQGGDMDAYAELFIRYQGLVHHFIMSRVRYDWYLAEDLTQETFLRALRRISSITYQGRDVAAWFVTIARNLVLDYVKSSRFRCESTVGEMSDSDRSPVVVEDEALKWATVAAIRHAMDQLLPEQRECLHRRFYSDQSVSIAALAMKRNEGALKALQHRAVRRLAQFVSPDYRAS